MRAGKRGSIGEREKGGETEFPLETLTPRSSASTIHRRPPAILLMTLILLAAAAFRFVGLDNFPTPQGATPPGLEHDEVAHWLINQDILRGEHAVYFTEAYGHEALYHYLQAAFGAAVGDHALALRLPSAYFGVLLVAVSYALGRRLFGARVGLWAAAFLAVLFWPVFYSRLALRAISLPVFSGLSAYWWWRMETADEQASRLDRRRLTGAGQWRSAISGRQSSSYAVLAGLLAGLSLHTYMAARAVPIFFALYTLYLSLFHRAAFRRQRRQMALFWLALTLVAAPLAWFLLTNPGAEARVAEVDAPLRALLEGNMGPVSTNAVKIAGMFGLSGDPLWRQNVAGRPVLDPVMAALFYLGVAFSLWRWRDPRHAFLLLWLAASAIPSLVTIDAPSSIRLINTLPVLMLFPVVLIHTTPYLSTYWDKLSTVLVTRVASWLLVALLLYSGWSTVIALWRVWPANDEVRFVWQAALTEAAAFLDASPAGGAVAVGGWTPETMDPPTMELTLRREDLALRYFDPAQSAILPVAAEGQPSRMILPTALPLFPHLRQQLSPWERPQGEFTLYEIPARLDIGPRHAVDADFGNELRFLGYDVIAGCDPGGSCELATYWQVMAPADGPRRLFLHAVDTGGSIVAQDDRLGAPAAHWQPGDLFIQLLTLPQTAAEYRLGVYDPTDGRRLETDSADYLMLDIQR